jgi:ribosome-binding protein aMBF1 (putative translation factor)
MTTHQDWKPITFEKKVEKVKRDTSRQYETAKNRNLESDLDITDTNPVIKPLPKLDRENQLLMIGMRTAKKLTQVQLAKQLNVTKDVIASLESGKVINDIFIIQKVNRALGTKLNISKN